MEQTSWPYQKSDVLRRLLADIVANQSDHAAILTKMIDYGEKKISIQLTAYRSLYQ
jgi:hypothetical protein